MRGIEGLIPRVMCQLALVAAMGCGRGKTEEPPCSTEEPLCSTEDMGTDSVSDPPWLFPTTAFSIPNGGSSEDDHIAVRITAQGHAAVELEDRWVDVDSEEADRSLQERTDSDVVENGLFVSRPRVLIEVERQTPWRRVLTLLHLFEQWNYRRVCMRVDQQRMNFRLPINIARHYPPIPDEALIPIQLGGKDTARRARFAGRWCDIETFRARVQALPDRIKGSPSVVVLDIGRAVHSEDVLEILAILVEADIGRFLEKVPPPPR